MAKHMRRCRSFDSVADRAAVTPALEHSRRHCLSPLIETCFSQPYLVGKPVAVESRRRQALRAEMCPYQQRFLVAATGSWSTKLGPRVCQSCRASNPDGCPTLLQSPGPHCHSGTAPLIASAASSQSASRAFSTYPHPANTRAATRMLGRRLATYNWTTTTSPPSFAAFSVAPHHAILCGMRETIIESTQVSLYYHSSEKIVHHQLHSYPGIKLLQELLLRGLEIITEKGATKWLSDDRNGGALPQSHHEWGDNFWAPQAVKAGWKYWGLVLRSDLLHSANMRKLARAYAAKGVTVEVFTDPDEAFHWLRQQGSPVTTSGR